MKRPERSVRRTSNHFSVLGLMVLDADLGNGTTKSYMAMKNRGFISDKTVCSNSLFIVYSHTKGILAEPPTLEEAQRIWEMEISRCAERGKESDALIFQWLQGHWFLCGDMYDLAEAGASPAHWKP